MLNDVQQREQSEAIGAPRKLAVIINLDAGNASNLAIEDLQNDIRSRFARHGIDIALEAGSGAELMTLAKRAALRARVGGADAIVIGGGDGSIRTAANALAGSDTPLGILPLGTRNHFARDVGLPLDLDAAAEVIARGVVRTVDVAEVNDEVFINNSSIGVYPYLVIERERRRARRKFAKWLAALPALVRLIRAFPRRRLALSAEGWTRPYRTPCLFIGNNEYSTDLFTLGRRQHLDRGELAVSVVKQRRPLGFFWMIVRLCFGRGSESRDIEHFKLKDLFVRARASRLPVALDGEVEIMRPPLLYRSRPQALKIIAPAGEAEEQPSIA
jgi:diacylglycerol kinase family enzyme